jgi:hypothetical protein
MKNRENIFQALEAGGKFCGGNGSQAEFFPVQFLVNIFSFFSFFFLSEKEHGGKF